MFYRHRSFPLQRVLLDRQMAWSQQKFPSYEQCKKLVDDWTCSKCQIEHVVKTHSIAHKSPALMQSFIYKINLLCDCRQNHLTSGSWRKLIFVTTVLLTSFIDIATFPLPTNGSSKMLPFRLYTASMRNRGMSSSNLSTFLSRSRLSNTRECEWM